MTREEEIARASKDYHIKRHPNFTFGEYVAFIDGARWADSSAWKNVKDELPDFDREVVVLIHQHLNHKDAGYRVSMGHRPNPNGYVIVDGEKLYAKTYDGWNQSDVEWWLDLDLPFEED